MSFTIEKTSKIVSTVYNIKIGKLYVYMEKFY